MKRRGLALITVLLMLTILVIIVVALLFALRGENFLTLGYAQRTSALYVAEAGLAVCQSSLESDNTWDTDIISQQLPHGGTFTVKFSDGSSVNNLTGTSPLDGPRGPGTVLAGTADVTITARAGIISRTLEVILGNQGLIAPAYALTAGGLIHLQGAVNITGVTAAGNSTGVPAGIFSNYAGRGGNVVTWSPINPGDTARISGQIGTVSTNPNAVNLSPGATVANGIKSGQTAQSFPPVDIASLISSKAGSPRPTILGVGTTTLGAGDYYYNGNLTTNGDLQLDGANLYVNGKLTVNGSINGAGSVYVGSQTSFHGNSSVTAGGDGQQIALYSHGDVTLSGFNGTAWLNAFTTANGLSTQWSEIQNTFAAMQSYMATNAANPQGYYWNGSPFDRMGDGMRGGAGNTPTITTPGSPVLDIENAVAAQPTSPTQQFILGQLQSWVMDNGTPDTAGMFRAHSGGGVPWIPGAAPMSPLPYSPPGPAAVDWWNSVNGMLNNGTTDGIVDGINDLEADQYLGNLQNVIDQYDPNHIGQAYFRGLVYTDGNFNAINEVSLQGALVAGNNLNLGDGTTVTFVNQFFQVQSPGLNKMAVKAWLGK